jgi:predicted  nucleic acid-binding Zn-ribbon protein
MAKDGKAEQANRAVREHLERTRARLADGRARLDRLHESIQETNEHIESMSGWIAETERTLAEERERKADE